MEKSLFCKRNKVANKQWQLFHICANHSFKIHKPRRALKLHLSHKHAQWKERALQRFSELIHTWLILTHTRMSKQAFIPPGCLRMWRPQLEEDVWSGKGYVFLTLAFTESWTLYFNNPVNTRRTERHTVDGGGRAFPGHFGVPYCPLSTARLAKERTRISIYYDTGKEKGQLTELSFVCYLPGNVTVRASWGMCVIGIRRYPGRSPSCPAPWPPSILLCRCAWVLLSSGRPAARTTWTCSCPGDHLIEQNEHVHTKQTNSHLIRDQNI